MNTIALVTGANKGIGFETARLLAERGMTVLVGSRDLARGEKAAAQLPGAVAIQIDVTDDASIAQAAELVTDDYGRLDVLVNNAGITGSVVGSRGGPSEATREALQEVFETNVFGLVAVTNAFLPLLRASKSARIVNVSSEVGSFTSMTDPTNPLSAMAAIVYPASKTAVNMATVMYAKELKDTPVKINAAIPGHCATDLTRHTGDRTAVVGATVSVTLATLPDDGPTGCVFADDMRQLPF
ncbi:SDR family oxidoreductase [Actinoplanes couchii]|uniref:Dehydrogenase n=1 Tax=Actinoplanes couchii TaxID=403638 RepID=A0ABQ3XDU3_9ACTN|nr:SDR family oxidoreductase [Actinoplanes couchii]MDR6317185.1 NAD(P)-dependent dehydrogenase (short-subunit alcohol dehydrogenase family) [Actinoplanes couchii]GID56680.1 dehydrogenase [Actinoplanes couchii]